MDRTDDVLNSKLVSSNVNCSGFPFVEDPENMFGIHGIHQDQEMKQLKELLLVNLDLIQHQQDLLMSNDRTIQSLRQENEMLKSRLERIERRMSLVQQKEISSNSGATRVQPVDSGLRRREAKRRIAYEHDQVSQESENLLSTTPITREPDFVNEEKKSKPKPAGSGMVGRKPGKQIAQSDVEKSHAVSDVSQSKDTMEKPKVVPEKIKKSRIVKRVRRDSEILKTDVLYYVQPILLDEVEDDVDDHVVSKPSDVPVPSWRFKQVHTLYVMEGTENLDDHIFLKRHQKSETEEKRRKRWDIQRLRDMNLLRKNRPIEDSSPGTCVTRDEVSFVLDPEKVLYIEVDNSIPVTAFGQPLPSLIEQEFHLSWFDVNKDHLDKNKKGKPKKSP